MKIIDDLGDPVIANAARQWLVKPREGMFSVTELVAPTRLSALRRQYWDQLEQNASDMIFALMGNAMHEVLHKGAEGADALSEHRMTDMIGDSVLTGALDYFSLGEDGTLVDYKNTSVYAIMDGPKPEWSQQLNGYAMLLRREGKQPKRLVIRAILRDWSRAKMEREPDYPKSRVVTLEVPLWPEEQARSYFEGRAVALKAAVGASQDAIPVCSETERWAKPTTWAVMKPGAVRALRVLLSAEEASIWQASQKNPGELVVQHRPGESTRCKFYCPVSRMCSWWAKNAT